MLEFPKKFWWGAATSGPQSEGRFDKKHANMFDYWYEIEPEVFYKQQGPDTASNFYNSYKKDIQLMKECGLNSVRTSIQWTRLIDDLETNTVNSEAVDFYNRVIDEFIAQGIEPIINLHHFDLPVELYHKYGGWESKHVVDLFVGFATQCFKHFGDRVKYWFTHNEPMVVVEGEYLYEFHYPKIVDGKKAVQVAYNLQLASSKAIEAFRTSGFKESQIGIILNLTPLYPATEESADLLASHQADLWINRFFMDASVKGQFPTELVAMLQKEDALWSYTDEELAIIAENTVDQLGINFYHPHRVERPEFSPNSLAVDFMPNKYWKDYEMPGRRMNVDKGWEIYPKALYDIAKDIQENYGNISWFVSENGMGVSNEERYLVDGRIEDDYRIQFISEHLYWLNQAIQEGANCHGYHLWTPIDCWSWMNAYRNRYGLISTNIHTQVKTIKKSGYWFKELSETGQLDFSLEE
ncbi:glycoside hydrolase family 1 protein [Enterococcus lemanii]|uniref:Glycoside hydrolase family 1 protein n=1 Tax=Enterococcus lemanii TaxID=1159752 RepID=A0ABV9MVZ0_9ENTE|nr:glycoside hydrolase family 1 protein [Enterococcus lemanii]MBM7710050.1 6-phospho-beta-glucosidase [Enterococcus lemanii]